MKNFKLKFNWSITSIYTNAGDVIYVWANGQYYGKCEIEINGNQIVGSFNLEKDVDPEMHVNYLISVEDTAGQMWLQGIMLLDYKEGMEKKSNSIGNTLLH
ncbi:hypothetical protein [Chitinophaga sp. Cy-1792]|uniref:hypothetical protein n=1 Tax=Chitinophaga sp. Cy-1792 TaxID=2608339 RepID=UPI0014247A1D|nr:hypothetical protein [Chitinophaga sp. Cy-1792]NIG54560.1 hypothetical protein [Chitinophaga sp. Cy-1792]